MLSVHLNVLLDGDLKADAGEEEGERTLSYHPTYVGKLLSTLRTQYCPSGEYLQHTVCSQIEGVEIMATDISILKESSVKVNDPWRYTYTSPISFHSVIRVNFIIFLLYKPL
jgi:hypothetical protein